MTKDEAMLLADAFDEAGRAHDPVRLDQGPGMRHVAYDPEAWERGVLRRIPSEAEQAATRTVTAVLHAISGVFRSVADKLP